MTTPDTITLRDTGSKFAPHPEGQYAALCVDTIDMGERVETYPGKPPKVVDKFSIVFWTGEKNAETGEPHEVQAEFTASMHERAGARLFLESWRGRTYTDDEAKKGIPIHKLVGVYALLSVEHKVSKGGRKYAKIKSIQPLPKQMPKPDILAAEYIRGEFWAERKDAYRAEVRQYRSDAVDSADDYNDASDNGQSVDDPLPF